MSYFQVQSGDVISSNHMNTAINQGIPPFTGAAARDSAYAGIGGPRPGMSCWLNDLKQRQVWNGSYWVPTGGIMPMLRVVWDNGLAPPLSPNDEVLTGGNSYSTPNGPVYDPSTGYVTGEVAGMYLMTGAINTTASVQMFLSDVTTPDPSHAFYGSWGGLGDSVASSVAAMVWLGPGQVYCPMVYIEVASAIAPNTYAFLTFNYISDADQSV
jgi:hypothetical protein